MTEQKICFFLFSHNGFLTVSIIFLFSHNFFLLLQSNGILQNFFSADARRLHHAVHAERISLPRGSYFAPSRASSGSFFSPPRPSIGPYFTPFRPSTGSFFPSPRSSNGSLFRPSNSASSTPAPGSSPQQLVSLLMIAAKSYLIRCAILRFFFLN